jgi:crossover junction endodeoxyribonuclease RuvC
MRVLGLDPGSAHTGWGVVEFAGSTLVARAWGRISPPARAPLGERLRRIAVEVDRLLAEQAPDLVALERVFFGKNARSLIVLAEARGAILVAVAQRGTPIAEVAPAMVKSVVTGDGRADKERLARMVGLQLGLGVRPLPADASDALAVAIAGRQVHSADRARGV